MKPISDALQIGLSLPGWYAFLVCLIIVWIGTQSLALIRMALRLIRMSWGFVRPYIVFPFGWPLVAMCVPAFALFLFRDSAADGLQWMEYNIYPVYDVSDTSQYALRVYEAELYKQVSSSEAETIKRRTREIAAKCGSTPLAIYEVAYSECGLNPFTIRKDGIAAGWIQFTSAGLVGLNASLAQVKEACKRRDIGFVMDLTEAYLLDRAKGKAMPRAIDVYTCVFAPGYVGATDEQVLYEGVNNPAYYKNIGFDGYYTEQGRIFYTKKARDGRITIKDVRLHLEAKKAWLLRLYAGKV